MPLAIARETLESLVSTTDAASMAGVTVAAVSNWRDRGYIAVVDGERQRVFLTPAAHDGRKRPLYRWIDIAKAEHATRGRARRVWPAA